ncbi:alpha/beta hydrolase-fold protein [uncultured Maricaulis sp.]|uniref:alpha/beta hydrolase n=1 Tax=uncultured Maricaulis sp. TaxID=174710 RepID=UPI00263892EE|nr:alpha/beta hydrolase-fold protein [uncultured Maricaulis sp.]
MGVQIRRLAIAMIMLSGLAGPCLAQAVPVTSSAVRALEDMLRERPHARDEAWRSLSDPRLPRIAPDPDRPDHARVTFAWRGGPETQSVRLDSVINVDRARQPVTDYREDFTLPMTRMEGADIWTLTLSVPRDVQAVYSFLVEEGGGEQRWSDPANPVRLGGRDGESLLRLDRAPRADIHRPLAFDAAIAPQQLRVQSEALGRTARLDVYRAPDAAPDAPLLILYDAFLWGQRAPASDLLVRLAEAGEIPATHLVLIDQLDAASADQAYADQAAFIADELLPVLRDQAGLAPQRETTLLAGASRRGLSASLTALSRPDVIGGVISLSGSFYWAPEGEAPEWAARQLSQAPVPAPVFHLAAGRLETVVTVTNRGHVMLDTNRAMAAALDANGYQAELAVYPGGHDIAGWRSALAEGLVALLGPDGD